MTIQKFNIGPLRLCCCKNTDSDTVAYILYPMDMLTEWIPNAAIKYGTSIIVITGMDWDNDLTPWTAPGVPSGSPDFRGNAPKFLRQLTDTVIPTVESYTGISSNCERTLVGVSLSGLFTLWQWGVCDTFKNIASLSGSFWYEGFMEWFNQQNFSGKSGKAYFLLGNLESKSRVRQFDSVGTNTSEIVSRLKSEGVNTEFESVPGNHYYDPIGRLDRAFAAMTGR